MSQRVGEEKDSGIPVVAGIGGNVENGGTDNNRPVKDNKPTRNKLPSRDSTSIDLCTPGKGDSKKSGSSSNSSNSSGSGGDNNYSADCSGDGGSDDNQSSDDTSGTPKLHAMMLDSSAMLAHHQHHHHHHKHKSAAGNSNNNNNNNQYINDNTSSGSSSSNDDDDDDDDNKNGIEQTQQQLSKLSTNATSKSALSTNHHTKGSGNNNNNNNNNTIMIDPRINLSLVQHIPSSSLVLPLHATATAALLQCVTQNLSSHTPPPSEQQHPSPFDSCHGNQTASTVIDTTNSTNNNKNHNSNDDAIVPPHRMSSPTAANPSETGHHALPVAPMLTVENYLHLMEAVRPFFSVQGVMYPQYVPYRTAHATTLDDSKMKGDNVPVAIKNNNNNNNNSTNPSSSEGFTSFFTTTTDESSGDKKASTKVGPVADDEHLDGTNPEEGITDDNASMAVFARAKRKYARSIQRSQNLQQKQLQTMESTTTSSSSDASSSNARDQNLRNYAPADNHNHNHPSSNDHTKQLSRMITDVSSSNPTTTSGSGSGDNGMNTTTGGSGSGTGSNQGSSGSGNDGKGSSEELAKEDSNSGGDGMNGSDGPSNKINNHRSNQVTSSVPDDSNVNATDRQPSQQNQHKSLSIDVRGDGLPVATTTTETATREQKMLVKKRKRIVMRREYEAQQRQMSSSESSGDSTEHFFPPGRPLTLDQVLVFSKIPRLVIQGTPPFLIVHMNAACCRLSGIDAHLLVGKPISMFLSMPSFSVDDGEIVDDAVHTASTTTIKPTVGAISATATETSVALSQSMATVLEKCETQMTIDRLIMTCGCDGVMHLVNVQTKLISPSVDSDEHNKILCRLSIAPIVVSKDIVGGGTMENQDQSKRARNQYNQVGSQEVPQLPHQELKFPLITHFVIQFEIYDSDRDGDSMESLSSSNSVDEDQHIGTPANKFVDTNVSSQAAEPPSDAKTDPAGSNAVDNNIDPSNREGSDVDGSNSVQSSDREPIVAIG